MKILAKISGIALGAALTLTACQSATTGDGGRLTICPADQMQGLVGKKANESGKYLGKVPADQRTPTYYVGQEQSLPENITRGSTLVVLNTPVVGPDPDLTAYTVQSVKCFTGTEWAN